jgi:hypothetical protein
MSKTYDVYDEVDVETVKDIEPEPTIDDNNPQRYTIPDPKRLIPPMDLEDCRPF